MEILIIINLDRDPCLLCMMYVNKVHIEQFLDEYSYVDW